MPTRQRAPLVEYRLTWETCDPRSYHLIQNKYGNDCWSRMTEEQWNHLRWIPMEQLSLSLLEVIDRRAKLALWAESHDMPVRKVLLERRSVHLSYWEPV